MLHVDVPEPQVCHRMPMSVRPWVIIRRMTHPPRVQSLPHRPLNHPQQAPAPEQVPEAEQEHPTQQPAVHADEQSAEPPTAPTASAPPATPIKEPV